MTLYRGGSTTMFTLGFFAGMVLSPFRAGVTLMMHRVKAKIPLKSNTIIDRKGRFWSILHN
jgi:hypothetical protein